MSGLLRQPRIRGSELCVDRLRLKLAAPSLAGHPDPERFAAEFSGSERLWLSTCWPKCSSASRPETLRHLLLRTSILERVCGLLTGGVGAEAVLHRLEQGQRLRDRVGSGRRLIPLPSPVRGPAVLPYEAEPWLEHAERILSGDDCPGPFRLRITRGLLKLVDGHARNALVNFQGAREISERTITPRRLLRCLAEILVEPCHGFNA